MSTRINVTVGDGGLLDRNAQQTAANRQARVLADQRATAEAEGVERRAADRTAAGLDPLTGLPASTPSSASTINRLDQEPAANRRGAGVLLVPQTPYVDFGGTLTGVYGRAKSGGRVLFSRFVYEDTVNYVFGRYSPELRFAVNEGPDNNNALALDYSYPFVDQGIFTDYLPGPGPLPQGTFYNVRTSPAERAVLQYAVTPSAYDGLSGNPQSLTGLGDPPPYDYLDLTGEVNELLISKANSTYTGTTHELLIRFALDTTKLGELRTTSSIFIESVGRTVNFTMRVEGFDLLFAAYEDVELVLNTSVTDPDSGFPINANDVQVQEKLHLRIEVRSSTAFNVENESPSGLLLYSGSSNPNDPLLGTPFDPLIEQLDGTEWCHCALVRVFDSSINNYKWFMYWRGKKLASFIAKPEWLTSSGAAPVRGALALISTRASAAPPEYLLPAVHGYRFTSKALYRDSVITPPPSITRLV
jgi:hypothetical protein